MVNEDANSQLGAQARLRLVFLKALFSRRPMFVVERWKDEQFPLQTCEAYTEPVRAEWIES